MRVTLNELESGIRKAAMGAGWPYGLADDAGKAAVWLMRRGLDPMALLVCVASPPGTATAKKSADTWSLTCPALAATSAFDLLTDAGATATLPNGPCATLLGLAGAASSARGCGFRITFGNATVAEIGPVALRLSGTLVTEAAAEITLLPTPPAATPDAATCEVDAALWAEVQRLAAQGYVPATEASRHKGAGAGLTDND